MSGPLPIILYVEDDENDVILLRHLLKSRDLRAGVVHVGNPRDFRATLEHLKPDLILADGNVPGFDTRAALETARRHCPEVPFYYVSGLISEAKARELLASGARGCLRKDDTRGLTAAIGELIAGREAADGDENRAR